MYDWPVVEMRMLVTRCAVQIDLIDWIHLSGPTKQSKRKPLYLAVIVFLLWSKQNQKKIKFRKCSQSSLLFSTYSDISFLYDVPAPEDPKLTPIVRNDASKPRDTASLKKPLELPDSLVPDEYHIVKNKGVVGLEYYDRYTYINNIYI